MKKSILKSWKSLLSLALTLALVVGGSNVFQAQAASAKVYSNNFEKSVGTFKGFGGAKVKLSSKVDLSASNASENANISSLAADVVSDTAKIAYVKEYDVANANIDLTKYLPKNTKEDVSKATSIKIVMSVDTAENYSADKTASAQLYFMGNATWAWVTGDAVSVKAGEDFTVSIPASKLTWGDADTGVGQVGVQLFNFKEGDVKYTVKSVTLEGLDAEPTPAVEEPSVDDSAYSVGKAKSGKNYLFVTNRWDATSGAKVDLSKKMKAGSTYKVTAYVKSVGEDSDNIQLLCSNSAKANGTKFAKVKAKAGKWVKIEGTVAVPKTAKNVIIKFNTKETSIDFGIDNVTVKKVANGKTSKVK